jgi:hypothetical protein
MFKRIRSNPAHTSETALPLLSVLADPHRILWALKSPKIINGERNCEIRLVSSAGETGTAEGR